MPGVLILEAMAQASAILSFKSIGTLPNKESVYYFVGIDKARFKRPVEPGDQLRIESRLARKVKGSGCSSAAPTWAMNFVAAPS